MRRCVIKAVRITEITHSISEIGFCKKKDTTEVGFVLIAKADNKGRASRPPIKAEICRALCLHGC